MFQKERKVLSGQDVETVYVRSPSVGLGTCSYNVFSATWALWLLETETQLEVV